MRKVLLILFAILPLSCAQYIPAGPQQPAKGSTIYVDGQPLDLPADLDRSLMVGLAAELERVLAIQRSRGSSEVSSQPITPHRYNSSGDAVLYWEYHHRGDYNQDGLVGVSDLTPIGQNFEISYIDDYWHVARVADGDGDGLITVADITSIGQHYQAFVADFVIEAAEDPDGPWAEVGRLPRTSGLPPDEGGLLTYSYLVEGGAAHSYYRVVGDDESGGGGGSGDKWQLWSNGTMLRGANIWQAVVITEVYEDTLGPGYIGHPYTQADFDALASWGCNYVNVSHPGLYTVDAPYQLDEQAQTNLDNLLAMIESADMFAVITFRTGPGRSEFSFVWGEDTTTDPVNGWFPASMYNERVWQEQAAQDAWVEMWRHAADRYKDNQIVAGYDLMCEPNSNETILSQGDPPEPLGPDEFYPAHANTPADFNPLSAAIVEGIREVDTETPILASCHGYGAVLWLPHRTILSDNRTVYAVHQYAPAQYTHQLYENDPTLPIEYPGLLDEDWDGTPETPFNLSTLQGIMATIDQFKTDYGVPVASNEWGPIRYELGAHTYVTDLGNLFDQRGVNNAIWEWTSAFESGNSEITWNAFNFRHGPDPANHTEVASSEMIEAIKAYWGRNTVRPSNYGGTSPPPAPPQDRFEQLASIRHFMYQIQGLEEPGAVDALAATHYDLVVVEPTSTFAGQEGFDTAGMVATLKASPDSRGGSKLVLAYVDIGEAEDYRTYWQGDWVPPTATERGEPDFLVTVDPDGWSGNYPVAYWDQQWVDIMVDNPDSILNLVLDAGFDGIYMDWVEAYDDERVIDAADDDSVDAPAEMVAFIGHLRDAARARDPEFLVLQQNAPFLIEEATGLAAVIDGLSMEDTWFLGEADVDWGDPRGGDTPQATEGGYTTQLLLEVYQLYQAEGLPVWTVDYCLNPANAVQVYAGSSVRGLVPLVTQTSLMQITETAPPWY